MTTKIQNIKTKCPKKAHEMSFVEKVAYQVGCSTRMVHYVLNEKRNHQTYTAQKILIAAAITEERENKLLQEVRRIVNF